MCPACIAAMTIVAVKATSAGGLGALTAKRLHTKLKKASASRQPVTKAHDGPSGAGMKGERP